MSDLISRKDLLEIIAQTKRVVNSENQDYYKGYICALSGIEGVIAGQPTAYDVDKVVEELEALTEKHMRNSEKASEIGYEAHMILNGGKGMAYEHAIEIVKGGGVNE